MSYSTLPCSCAAGLDSNLYQYVRPSTTNRFNVWLHQTRKVDMNTCTQNRNWRVCFNVCRRTQEQSEQAENPLMLLLRSLLPHYNPTVNIASYVHIHIYRHLRSSRMYTCERNQVLSDLLGNGTCATSTRRWVCSTSTPPYREAETGVCSAAESRGTTATSGTAGERGWGRGCGRETTGSTAGVCRTAGHTEKYHSSNCSKWQ